MDNDINKTKFWLMALSEIELGGSATVFLDIGMETHHIEYRTDIINISVSHVTASQSLE